MEINSKFLVGLLLLLALPLGIYIAAMLVKWARTRSTGAMMTGALLSAFAPDPALEQNLKLVEQAGQRQQEEDEEGEGKD